MIQALVSAQSQKIEKYRAEDKAENKTQIDLVRQYVDSVREVVDTRFSRHDDELQLVDTRVAKLEEDNTTFSKQLTNNKESFVRFVEHLESSKTQMNEFKNMHD